MSDVLLVERAEGVVTLTFNRPHKKNALSSQSWIELDAALAEIAASSDDRAVILTGAGECFSSGADLTEDGDELSDWASPEAGESFVHKVRRVNEIIRRLQRLPKPTIAAVDGVAVGVALGLALACDLIIATDRARFAQIFVKRGLTPDGGSSWTLPRAVGIRRAKQMSFFGDLVGADDALAWGMINEVVAPAELRAVSADWARRLADQPATALSLIKRLIDDSVHNNLDVSLEDEARSQHVACTTADFQEGMRAFVERRAPNFRG